eukprot:3201722-Rhodomonas_salina.2
MQNIFDSANANVDIVQFTLITALNAACEGQFGAHLEFRTLRQSLKTHGMALTVVHSLAAIPSTLTPPPGSGHIIVLLQGTHYRWVRF